MLAGIMFFFYRTDRQASEQRLSKITENFLQVIQDNTVLDTLWVVNFSDPRVLARLTGSFFRMVSANSDVVMTDVENPLLKPGFVEASNVDLSRQLIELPLNSKKYDANSKALQIIRKSQTTAREMGRVQ